MKIISFSSLGTVIGASAGLLFSMVPVKAGDVFHDDFDGGDLANWQVELGGVATGWRQSEVGGHLTVTDILAPSTSGPVAPWAIVDLTRPVPALLDFEINMQISWDSENTVNAMQGVKIGLFDDEGKVLGDGGYFDAWVRGQGEPRSVIGPTQYNTPLKQPHAGSALITISRTGTLTTFAWNGSVLSQGHTSAATATAQITFTTAKYDGPAGTGFFGTIKVDYVSLLGLPNAAPTADAGENRLVRLGSTVELDGSGSFDSNTPSDDLVYDWSVIDQPSGADISLIGANTAMPQFVADVVGDYTFALVVSDDADPSLSSEPSFVTISSAPLKRVFRYDFEGDDLSNWDVALGGVAEDWDEEEVGGVLRVKDIMGPVSNQNSAPWAFVNLTRSVPPVLDFELNMRITWDSEGSVNAMQGVKVGLFEANGPVVVDGGYFDAWVLHPGEPRSVIGPTQYNTPWKQPFEGSALITFVRTGSHVRFLWNGVQVSEGTATEDPASAGITFTTAPYSGSSGTGFFGEIEIDYVELLGLLPNAKPIAVAGVDQVVRAGAMVQLDGRGSSDDYTDAERLEYSWSIVDYPSGGAEPPLLFGAETATPRFVPDLPGIYVLELLVADDCVPSLSSLPDWVVIDASNLAPVSDAEPEVQIVILGGTAILLGDAWDPEGDPIADYQWQIASAPEGSAAEIVVDSNQPNLALLMPDLQGRYGILFNASDHLGFGEADEVQVIAVTALQYVGGRLIEVGELLEGLNRDQIRNRGNLTALLNFVRQAFVALEEGDILEVINKVTAIMLRTDGCPLRGTPDGNGPERDWIIDCAVQEEVYALIRDVLDVLLAHM